MDSDQTVKTLKEIEELLKKQGDLTKKHEEALKRASGTMRTYGEIAEESMTKASKRVRDLTKDLKKQVNRAQETERAFDNLQETLDDINFDKISSGGDAAVRNFRKQSKAIEKSLEDIAKSAGPNGILTAEQFYSKKQLDITRKRMALIRKDAKSLSESLDETHARKGRVGALKEAGSSMWDALKSGESGKIQAAAKGIKGSGIGGMASKIPGVGKLLTGAAAGAGVGGMIAKFAGPAGLVISAGSLINKVITGLDDYRKEANKDYKALAGPVLDGSQFEKASKSYNRSIRDIDFNIGMGMEAKDWNAMFQAMGNAGVGVDQLSGKLGDQRDIMKSVRETSIALGMDTDKLGESYVNLTQETRSGLDTVQEGFENIARGAQMAGITGDKFYSVIQSSILEMGSFGNYTNMAAASLAKLSTYAGMSQKEVEALANSMVTGYQKMDAKGKLAYTGLLAGARGMGNMMKDLDVAIEEIDKKLLNVGKGSKEEGMLKSQRARLNVAKNSGNPMLSYAKVLPMLTQNKSKNDMAILRQLTGQGDSSEMVANMLGGLTDQMASALQSYGLGEETVSELSNQLSTLYSTLDPLMGGINDTLKKISQSPEAKDELSDVLTLLAKGEKITTKDAEAIDTYFKQFANTANMTSDQLAELVKTYQTSPRAFAEALAPGIEGGNVNIADVIDKVMSSTSDETDKWGKRAVKGQKAAIKALTPMEKMFDITKDSIFYNMAASDAAVTSAKLLYDLKALVYQLVHPFTDPPKPITSPMLAKAEKEAAVLKERVVPVDKQNRLKGLSTPDLLLDFEEGGDSTKLAAELGVGTLDELKKLLETMTPEQFVDKAADRGRTKRGEAITNVGSIKLSAIQEASEEYEEFAHSILAGYGAWARSEEAVSEKVKELETKYGLTQEQLQGLLGDTHPEVLGKDTPVTSPNLGEGGTATSTGQEGMKTYLNIGNMSVFSQTPSQFIDLSFSRQAFQARKAGGW